MIYLAALSSNLGNILTSWLYSGIVEETFKVPDPPWTKEDWVFAAVNVNSTEIPNFGHDMVNVTLDTMALRGRLDCTPVDMLNHSKWLITHDFTNRTLWNDTSIPAGLKVGYELEVGYYTQWEKSKKVPLLPDDARLTCCGNETGDDIGRASIGYWTEVLNDNAIMIKWITGHPFSRQFKSSEPGYFKPDSNWIWRDIPSITALNCTPIFEIANANIKLDRKSGAIQKFKILDTPIVDNTAFEHNQLYLNVSAGVPYSNSKIGKGFGYLPPGEFDGSFLLNVTIR